MKRQTNSHGDPIRTSRSLVAIACAVLLVPGETALLAQTATPAAPAAAAAEADEPPLTADQLDSLVAPIALYPDNLLAQVLAASTYPLELVQLQQWMEKNKNLKDKALADAVGKQPWDPSVQSMAAVPEALKRLVDDIQWTTDLGNAFLEQQKDVMEACQRMRKKAQDKGALKTNEQQKVETKVVEQKQVIVVESANPEVIYVPSYNPAYVYPPPVYPYPPVYYPPYTAGAAFVSFGVGMMMGAAIWGGSCCGCGWGGGNVNVNVNNNFNRNTNVNRGQGGGNWNHNASHRGGTPYGNKATANKYGGSSRGQAGGRGGAGGRGSVGGAGGVASAVRVARGPRRRRRRGWCRRARRCGRRRWCGRPRAERRDQRQVRRRGKPRRRLDRQSRRGRRRRIARRQQRLRRWLRRLQRKQRAIQQLPRLVEHGLARRRRRRARRRRKRRRRTEVREMREDRGISSNDPACDAAVCAWPRSSSLWPRTQFAAGAQEPTGKASAPPPPSSPSKQKPSSSSSSSQKIFSSPKEAAEALISAAARFDVPALTEILGPDGVDLVVSDDTVQDRNRAGAFAQKALEKHAVVADPKNASRATLIIGEEDWPTPIPIVRAQKGWRFDAKQGRQEILYRRIGANELDAIQICHGYVEAQHEYASKKRDGSRVNQYAQKIISTPGKQDGLAWRTPDGKVEGPIGENIAKAIAEGYSSKAEPYHGYFFKILKGQGPSAPMGELDFVVKGVMIGGFALVAAPAEYKVTGVKTFIVSHNGVVYEKDLGEKTLEAFKAMERYNPDKTWKRVTEE